MNSSMLLRLILYMKFSYRLEMFRRLVFGIGGLILKLIFSG